MILADLCRPSLLWIIPRGSPATLSEAELSSILISYSYTPAVSTMSAWSWLSPVRSTPSVPHEIFSGPVPSATVMMSILASASLAVSPGRFLNASHHGPWNFRSMTSSKPGNSAGMSGYTGSCSPATRPSSINSSLSQSYFNF